MDYFQKYRKYKAKYLNLLKLQDMSMNMTGGSAVNMTGGSSLPLINNPTLFLFKSKNCGHCRNFQPTWDKLITDSNVDGNKVEYLSYDATNPIDQPIMNAASIQGYPTIIFKVDQKDSSYTREYNGRRTIEDITKFMKSELKRYNNDKKK